MNSEIWNRNNKKQQKFNIFQNYKKKHFPFKIQFVETKKKENIDTAWAKQKVYSILAFPPSVFLVTAKVIIIWILCKNMQNSNHKTQPLSHIALSTNA